MFSYSPAKKHRAGDGGSGSGSNSGGGSDGSTSRGGGSGSSGGHQQWWQLRACGCRDQEWCAFSSCFHGCFWFWVKTRAPSADGANLGHHAEPTLGEDLCAGTIGVGGAISARCG